MTDPEKTIPPIGARTPRNIGKWLGAWAVAHPDVCFMAMGLLAAFVLGAVLF